MRWSRAIARCGVPPGWAVRRRTSLAAVAWGKCRASGRAVGLEAEAVLLLPPAPGQQRGQEPDEPVSIGANGGSIPGGVGGFRIHRSTSSRERGDGKVFSARSATPSAEKDDRWSFRSQSGQAYRRLRRRAAQRARKSNRFHPSIMTRLRPLFSGAFASPWTGAVQVGRLRSHLAAPGTPARTRTADHRAKARRAISERSDKRPRPILRRTRRGCDPRQADGGRHLAFGERDEDARDDCGLRPCGHGRIEWEIFSPAVRVRRRSGFPISQKSGSILRPGHRRVAAVPPVEAVREVAGARPGSARGGGGVNDPVPPSGSGAT